MKILLSGPIENHLITFYKHAKTQNPHWVVCCGDFGVWPDPQRKDRAAKKHAGNDFAKMYIGTISPPLIPTLTIAGVHEDQAWLKQRQLMNNTEILNNVHWLAQGYRTTIGWNNSIQVTGLGKAYSEASYNEMRKKKSLRHYTRKDIERGCSSGPTDLLLIYETLDCPGIRNLIFATRPKLILNVKHHNGKKYSKIQNIPVIQLARHETKLITL